MIIQRSLCVLCVVVLCAISFGLKIHKWNWKERSLLFSMNVQSGSTHDQLPFDHWGVNATDIKRNNNIRSNAYRNLEDRDEHYNDEAKEKCQTDSVAPTSTPSSRKWRRGSSNNASSGSKMAKAIAPMLFLGILVWFCYHNFYEKVQQGEYDNAVKTAKQDLLSSDTIVDDENIVVYDTSHPHPTNGQYCAVYLEPQPLECGQTDIEQKYKINLQFEKDKHHDDESYCTVDGWSISGEGYDTSGDPIVVENGFVTVSGKACWTEKRKNSTVLCNGRFNFISRTFNGAWLSRNGNGGEFIRFYHHNKSIYKDVNMDNYAYKGPNVNKETTTTTDSTSDDPTVAMSDDSHTVIDVSDASDECDGRDDTKIIDVTYPQHRLNGRPPTVSSRTQTQSTQPATQKQVTFTERKANTTTTYSTEKDTPLISSGMKQKEHQQQQQQQQQNDKVIVPVDLTKYQNYEPPTVNNNNNTTSASPDSPIWVTDIGRLRPIDEESTLISVPITLVMTTSCDESACSELSTSNSCFQQRVQA